MAALTRISINDGSLEGSTLRFPVPTAPYLFAMQLKPSLLARLESAGAVALHTLSFNFNLDNATGTQGIGVCSANMCRLHGYLLDYFVGQ